MIAHIHWLGHATVRLDFDKIIYVDPWKIRSGAPKADLILITHDHYDHFSKPDVDKIRKDSTSVVTIATVAAALKGNVHVVKPGDSITIQGVGIQAVPAYNIGKQFHPKAAGYVGFVIQTGGHAIYIAGDSDLTPEMKSVRADVALLPVGGKYTMTAEEAAQAANAIQPKLAIPLHYGDIVGSKADAERFRSLCKVPVQILQPE
ncbi:MAG: MBL fold metallo-hydrolase [Chloroflexi bacterium]|nr:MBL fold metallo-hydrolase [Chloroflexota bacterium]